MIFWKIEMKKIGLIFCLCVLCFVSCKRTEVTKSFFDTGELRAKQIFVGKDSAYYHIQKFYRNGQLQAKGHTLESGGLHGYWEKFYSDGSLKWRGYYNDGHIVAEELVFPLKAYLVFFDSDYVVPNEPFLFRIHVEQRHPIDLIVTYVFRGRLRQVTTSNVWDDDFPRSFVLTDDDFQTCNEDNIPYFYEYYNPEYHGGVYFGCDTVFIHAHLPPRPEPLVVDYTLEELPRMTFAIPVRRE